MKAMKPHELQRLERTVKGFKQTHRAGRQLQRNGALDSQHDATEVQRARDNDDARDRVARLVNTVHAIELNIHRPVKSCYKRN